MFFEVEIPILALTLINLDPLRMQSTIGHIPPLGSIYLGEDRPVVLVDKQSGTDETPAIDAGTAEYCLAGVGGGNFTYNGLNGTVTPVGACP